MCSDDKCITTRTRNSEEESGVRASHTFFGVVLLVLKHFAQQGKCVIQNEKYSSGRI